MPIQIIDNFDLNAPRPIDNRFVVGPTSFYTHRDLIPYKYPGMRIWDLNDSIPYVWTGTTYSSENSVAVTGTGTPTRVPKLTLSNVIGDSLITDSGTNVGIGFSLASSATEKLHVSGNIKSDGGTGFIGFGGSITNLNASNITSGTMSLARLTNTSANRILMSGGFPGSSTSPQWISSSNVSVGTASNLSVTNDTSSPAIHYLSFFPTSSGGTAKISSSKLQFIPQTGNFLVDGNVTSTRIIIGTQPNKATIVYSTNTSRTLTVPNVTGDRTFAFINESQTFSVSQFIVGSSETMFTVERTTTNGNNYTFLKANGTGNAGIFYQNSSSARSLYMNATGDLITGGNHPNTSGFVNFKLNTKYLYLGAESNYTPAIRVNGALVSGTSSVPAYSFYGATDSGMYCDGGDVAFSHQGTRIAKFDRGMAHDFVLFSPNNAHSNGLSMYNSTVTLQTQGNFYVNGSLSKLSGSFRITHPLESKKSTHDLVHSFIEGPQADNIYRGKVTLDNGLATINLDIESNMSEGTFILLNREVQCFTTNETGWTAVKGRVTNNILQINSETNCSDEISWMVIGERHDKHMYDTEWTDDDGKVIVEPLKIDLI